MTFSSGLTLLLLLASHHQTLLVLLLQQHELHLVVVQRVGVAVELARPCCASATSLLLSHLLRVENQTVAAHESGLHSIVAHGQRLAWLTWLAGLAGLSGLSGLTGLAVGTALGVHHGALLCER